MVIVRHGVTNGAARETLGPLDDGDSTALKRVPSTRRSHIAE
jgi:hypothetical protein